MQRLNDSVCGLLLSVILHVQDFSHILKNLLYENNGGKLFIHVTGVSSSPSQLDSDAADILKELQQKLNGVLDELSTIFAKR